MENVALKRKKQQWKQSGEINIWRRASAARMWFVANALMKSVNRDFKAHGRCSLRSSARITENVENNKCQFHINSIFIYAGIHAEEEQLKWEALKGREFNVQLAGVSVYLCVLILVPLCLLQGLFPLKAIHASAELPVCCEQVGMSGSKSKSFSFTLSERKLQKFCSWESRKELLPTIKKKCFSPFLTRCRVKIYCEPRKDPT